MSLHDVVRSMAMAWVLVVAMGQAGADKPSGAPAEDAAEPRPVTVASAAELNAALKSATSGQVILLAPGEYGSVSIGKAQFDQPVTVRSADRAKPATISHLRLRDCRNVVFDGLVLMRGKQVADNSYYALVDAGGLDHVTFGHCRFVGATISQGNQAGYGSGFGIKTRGQCKGLVIRRCVMTNLNKALSTGGTEGLRIEQNVIHDYRQDAFYVSGRDMVIADNLVLDPRPYSLPRGKGDHPDFLQGYALRDVVIRDNFFRGGHSQGVFIHGSAPRQKADPNVGNVTIVNNVIYTYMRNALIVDRLPRSTIAHNVVLEHSDRMPYRVGVISANGKAGDGVVVEYNIAENVAADNKSTDDAPAVTYRHNIKVQRADADAEKYYGAVFVNALADEKATLRDFALKPGPLAERDPRPGVDLDQFDWLKMTGLDQPDHEMHPLWLQLDEAGRAKVRAVIGAEPRD